MPKADTLHQSSLFMGALVIFFPYRLYLITAALVNRCREHTQKCDGVQIYIQEII